MSSQTQPGAGTELLQDDETESEAEEVEDAEQEEAVAELLLDHVFEILKNERRRTVLHYLEENGDTVSLGELAEHVAAVENDTTVAQVTSNERKCVYVGLYQCHLPKMDNMDIVDFNQNRGRISLGPNAPQLYEYLGESTEKDRPWPLYYGAFAAAGGLLLALSHVGAASFGLTPTVVAGALLVAVIGCSAAQFTVRSDDD